MIRYAIFFLLVATIRLPAQEKYWIYFTDKGAQTEARSALLRSPASPTLMQEEARALGLSAHALARRQRRAREPLITQEDLPVAPEYLARLRQAGITPLVESRWLNAVSARLTPDERARVGAMPGVRAIEAVVRYSGDSLTAPAASLPPSSSMLQKQPRVPGASISSLDYGPSLAQLEMIDVPRVHELGITGRGVIVGMLDTGFRWRQHEALKDRRVLAEYDFIQHDTVTANQAGDSTDQDDHGTKTMSTLGGYMPGELIGPAFDVSFLLGKTEYVPAELNIEEDNWVAGIEWCERNGADVVSSSLGYSEFDPGQRSYTYQDMNGRTATTSKAAVIAARKGVVVCVAMGNEAAHAWHYLTSPADADSIISVGAVTAAGAVASFSSVGPTSDGRTKPDVCARGVQVICALASNTSQSLYTTNNGTSLSTPLAAGAAALLLSARPELTPVEVRDALRSTASNASSPNNSIGWGIVDVYQAIMAKGLLVSAELDATLAADSSRTISVHVIAPSSPLLADSLLCYYTTTAVGSGFAATRLMRQSLIDSATGSGVYTVTLPKQASHFYLSARDQNGTRRLLPARAPGELIDVSAIGAERKLPPVPEAFALRQNFPNPFNGQTTIRWELPRATHVSVRVYDILGRMVAQLIDEDEDEGDHFVRWNARSAASGVYFYTVRTTAGASETKKMLLVR